MKKTKILIAGGGIGGLAAGIALLQRGFDVEIFEQAPQLREFGGGIQISPNGNRALASLGVFAPLQALSCPAEAKEIRLWNTGETWPLFDLGQSAVRKFGYPYMTVFRPDLLSALAQEVSNLKEGAIYLNARAAGVEQSKEEVALRLADGRVFTGAILIGADGVHSSVRAALFGEDATLFTGLVAWRALSPLDALPPRFKRSVAVNWVGPGGHVVHYPIKAGELMNFVGTLEGQHWQGPPWSESASIESAQEAFASWHEDIRIMLSKASTVTRWPLLGRAFLATWTKGRATLLGDAAHPTLPFLAQGAVHTLEDAVILARCLAAHDTAQAALVRYDEMRRPRAYAMVRGAAENTQRFHNQALAQERTGREFIEREWQSEAIRDRYDWLFNYDVEAVPL